MINDLIKVSTGEIFSKYIINGNINKKNLVDLGVTLTGFIIYHLFTKKLIMGWGEQRPDEKKVH